MDLSVSILMGFALLFYSIAVWGEKLSSRLKWWHLIFFTCGLICDMWGTGMMLVMAGGLTFDIHGITGLLAIIFMLIHTIWALIVLFKKDQHAIKNFHKFSFIVWIIWLIPYLSPMFFNLAQ